MKEFFLMLQDLPSSVTFSIKQGAIERSFEFTVFDEFTRKQTKSIISYEALQDAMYTEMFLREEFGKILDEPLVIPTVLANNPFPGENVLIPKQMVNSMKCCCQSPDTNPALVSDCCPLHGGVAKPCRGFGCVTCPKK